MGFALVCTVAVVVFGTLALNPGLLITFGRFIDSLRDEPIVRDEQSDRTYIRTFGGMAFALALFLAVTGWLALLGD